MATHAEKEIGWTRFGHNGKSTALVFSTVLLAPVTIGAMSVWLEDFPYRDSQAHAASFCDA
ncbi:hypothetical protein [Hymenobacter glacialis]|uniref:hypothetical protein n=1 Tax=Hymenobacter glacialis TaxID=1908236 RepID=UPI000F79799C|nr:hypothetical protein [Hymenobacter glacialis]